MLAGLTITLILQNLELRLQVLKPILEAHLKQQLAMQL